jgi:hypothetical protein
MPKPSAINPQYPVWKSKDIADDGVIFDVVRINDFVSRDYGPSWRMFVTRHDTGETGILLSAKNMVRDDVYSAFAAECNAGRKIGPCVLVSVPLDSGRETWEVHDAPNDADIDAAVGRRPRSAPADAPAS